MLTQEQSNKNYELYSINLKKIIGEEEGDKLIESLGGEDTVKNATFGANVDCGSAYNGSLIENIFTISSTAKKINKLLPESIQVSDFSITKVAFLSHIAKALMFAENDNSWEKVNRGVLYKFNTLCGALRCGERSVLLSMNSGVRFTEEEFEAMRILDKTNADDTYLKNYSTVLSMVIRQANEIITIKNKNNVGNE